MNTKNTLARLYEIMPMCKMHVGAYNAMQTLISDLEADLRKEIAAENGSGNAHRVIVKMLNATKKDCRESLGYAWIDDHNRQCVCDGYRAFRFKDHMPLEARPDTLPERGLDMDAIYPKQEDLDEVFLPIKIPSIADVKAHIAIEKSKQPKGTEIIWHFGPDRPAVNAQYLLDLITVFPEAETIWYSTLLSPMYVECKAGDALLLPIRTTTIFDADKIAAARMLHDMQRDYRKNLHENPRYSLTPELFAEMVELADKIA